MSIKEHLFIVFSERNHYNPLGVVRSLGEEGITPDLIAYGDGPDIVASSRYIGNVHYVHTVEEGYKFLLDRYSNEKNKPFVITCDDKVTAFLDTKYDEIKDLFYFDNAGSSSRISYYMDKNNVCNLAVKHGLSIPKTHVVNRGEIPSALDYPIITKSISSNSGGWKEDVFICHSDDELRDAYRKIKSEVVVLQHFIEKKNELCLDGCVVNKGKDMLIAIQSKYNYNIPGKYACDYNSENFNDKVLEEKLSGMFQEVGFEGIFSIEFIIDQNDDLHFLEINFRNSTWSYTSTSVGMNLPCIWAEGMLLGHLPQNCRKEIKGSVRTMFELYDFSMKVKGKLKTIPGWFLDLKNVDCTLLYNSKDPKPFWVLIGDRVKKRLRLSRASPSA